MLCHLQNFVKRHLTLRGKTLNYHIVAMETSKPLYLEIPSFASSIFGRSCDLDRKKNKLRKILVTANGAKI